MITVPPPSSTAEPRIAQLSGDRACTKCAFNLSGQTIIREPHYGLLIVRCPECGTPASLQEYPALGRWGARLGHLAAGAWLGLMLGLIALSAVAIWGSANETQANLLTPYSTRISTLWNDHVTELQKAAQAAGATPTAGWPGYSSPQESQKWWEALDKRAIFRDLGGWWRGGIAWRGLLALIAPGLALASLGAVMGVATPHLRTRGRVLLVLLVLALGGAFLAIDWLATAYRPNYWAYYAYGYYGSGYSILPFAWTILPGLALICALIYAIGLWSGRSVARALIILLLPPRLRVPLAFLWIADGKPLPKPRRF